jgi:hypothetical protein
MLYAAKMKTYKKDNKIIILKGVCFFLILTQALIEEFFVNLISQKLHRIFAK